MEHYSVTGMSCAACSSRVEKAVSKVDGVTECTVSLLTNSMTVEGTAAPETIIPGSKRCRNMEPRKKIKQQENRADPRKMRCQK